ncbi:hypothetical protein CANCADRAFT_121602 [Tortispora caseinolytica NRRL Y-17796]|uniref:Uncharacterized protein n=1 Tax=Tortispora caseinolytica NRRL Y-17796 TaxID=767744 RepID=A0A1E4THI6_9ASCO|nr:hypothetical protein CANCADRAFT_121602 [Tortispora caseinolytica NRRL Y-17796]
MLGSLLLQSRRMRYVSSISRSSFFYIASRGAKTAARTARARTTPKRSSYAPNDLKSVIESRLRPAMYPSSFVVEIDAQDVKNVDLSAPVASFDSALDRFKALLLPLQIRNWIRKLVYDPKSATQLVLMQPLDRNNNPYPSLPDPGMFTYELADQLVSHISSSDELETVLKYFAEARRQGFEVVSFDTTRNLFFKAFELNKLNRFNEVLSKPGFYGVRLDEAVLFSILRVWIIDALETISYSAAPRPHLWTKKCRNYYYNIKNPDQVDSNAALLRPLIIAGLISHYKYGIRSQHKESSLKQIRSTLKDMQKNSEWNEWLQTKPCEDLETLTDLKLLVAGLEECLSSDAFSTETNFITETINTLKNVIIPEAEANIDLSAAVGSRLDLNAARVREIARQNAAEQKHNANESAVQENSVDA